MAKAKKRTSRGRKQDRPRVAGRQDYEVRYEAKKTGRSKAAMKTAVKKVGNTRKRVERRLGRQNESQARSGSLEVGRSGCPYRRIAPSSLNGLSRPTPGSPENQAFRMSRGHWCRCGRPRANFGSAIKDLEVR
jgi:Protein of unknown function (DUF3606)